MRKAICSVSCHELTMVFPSARDFEKTYLTRALKQPLPRYHPPGSAHHLRPARVPRGMGRSQPGAEGGFEQAGFTVMVAVDVRKPSPTIITEDRELLGMWPT